MSEGVESSRIVVVINPAGCTAIKDMPAQHYLTMIVKIQSCWGCLHNLRWKDYFLIEQSIAFRVGFDGRRDSDKVFNIARTIMEGQSSIRR